MQHPWVVALFSGKGGVGKSYLALQLAAGLARRGHRTVLVDLDFQTGGALAYQLQADAATNGAAPYLEREGAAVGTSVPRLDLIGAPHTLYHALRAQRRDLSQALGSRIRGYEWAVLDLSHRFDTGTVSALGMAHWVWIVTTQDPWARLGTQRAVERLLALGLERRRLRILVNGLTAGRMAPWFGLGTYAVPHERKAARPGGGAAVSKRCMARLVALALRCAREHTIKIKKDPTRTQDERAESLARA